MTVESYMHDFEEARRRKEGERAQERARAAQEAQPEWPDPIPLGYGPLPDFPIDALPGWLGTYATALATALQVPLALTGMLGLAATAATVANTVQVLVKPGYVEPVNLWVMIPLPSGNRKSATIKALTRPLAAWQEAQAHGMRDAIAEAETAVKIARGSLERAERTAAAATTETERLKATGDARVLAVAANNVTVPHAPRILTGDVTAERLVQLLGRHGGRMAVMSPEGTIFSLMEGRYSGGVPNIDAYLAGHAGDTIDVQRVGREPDYVESPALTLGVAPQPVRMVTFGQTDLFRESGLLARWLYAIPESLVGGRDRHAAPVPNAVVDAYDTALGALLALTPKEDEAGKPVPHTLKLSPDAFAVWDVFGEPIEPQLHPITGDLADIADWGSKLEGAVARLAGVLHMARHAGYAYPWAVPIGADTMAAACAIGNYLIPHAHTAFTMMGGAPSTNEAEVVLRWIEGKGRESFSEHELWQSVRRRFADQREALGAPLSTLVERGYIRPRDMPRPQRGQQPTQIYDVHPIMRTHGTHESV